MDRRSFFQKGGAAAAGAAMVAGGAANSSVHAAVRSVVEDRAAAGVAPGPIQRPLQLHVGSQRGVSTPAAAQFFIRHGVKHWVPSPRTSGGRTYWVPSDLYKVQEFAQANGLVVEMVALPFLGSTNIDTESRPAIMLGQSPQRDRDIDDIHRCIQAMATCGVPAFKYNMSLLGVPRTASTPGRGGSTYSTFNASLLNPNAPPTIAGTVTAEMFWERINYFVQRVIPVCDQFKIMAACHPQDPGTPPGGYRGVLENVLSTPGGMGLFQFLNLHSSPYHGLNLCIGVLAEMLWDTNDIYDITRALARTKRLFNIHLRNIRGVRDNFQEVFPDEGDVNEARIVQILAEEGYKYSIDPDHIPNSSAEGSQDQGYAHGFGYIEALIKSVDTFSPPYDAKRTRA